MADSLIGIGNLDVGGGFNITGDDTLFPILFATLVFALHLENELDRGIGMRLDADILKV